MNRGLRLAENVIGFMGSWRFIIIQSTFLFLWILANVGLLIFIQPWDNYPFVFLNLMLSFQAAYSSPLILMASNAQAKRDKERQERDRKILETILALIEKIDAHSQMEDKRDQAMEHMLSSQQAIIETVQAIVINTEEDVEKLLQERSD